MDPAITSAIGAGVTLAIVKGASRLRGVAERRVALKRQSGHIAP